MKPNKRILVLLLILALGSFQYTHAEEAYGICGLRLRAGEHVQTEPALLVNGAAYIRPGRFTEYTHYICEEVSPGVYRYVAESAKHSPAQAYKKVELDTLLPEIRYTIGTKISYLPLAVRCGTDGLDYVSASDVFPLLNVSPVIENFDTLVLISDPMMMSDVMDGLFDYEFDMMQLIREDPILRSVLKALDISESIFSLRIRTFIPIVGESLDYAEIFEEFLAKDVYQFSKEELSLTAELDPYGERRLTMLDARFKEPSDELLGFIKQMSQLQSILKPTGVLSGEWIADAPLSELLPVASTANVLLSMRQDPYNILRVCLDDMPGIPQPQGNMRRGMDNTFLKYEGQLAPHAIQYFVEKELSTLVSAALNEGLMAGEPATLIIRSMKTLFNKIGNANAIDAARKLSMITQYAEIANYAQMRLEALAALPPTLERLNDTRLTALLYLLGNRGCYESMLAAAESSKKLDILGDSNPDVERGHIKRIDTAIRRTYILGLSMEDDALDGYDERVARYADAIAKLIERGFFAPEGGSFPGHHPPTEQDMLKNWVVTGGPLDGNRFFILPKGEMLTLISEGVGSQVYLGGHRGDSWSLGMIPAFDGLRNGYFYVTACGPSLIGSCYMPVDGIQSKEILPVLFVQLPALYEPMPNDLTVGVWMATDDLRSARLVITYDGQLLELRLTDFDDRSYEIVRMGDMRQENIVVSDGELSLDGRIWIRANTSNAMDVINEQAAQLDEDGTELTLQTIAGKWYNMDQGEVLLLNEHGKIEVYDTYDDGFEYYDEETILYYGFGTLINNQLNARIRYAAPPALSNEISWRIRWSGDDLVVDGNIFKKVE